VTHKQKGTKGPGSENWESLAREAIGGSSKAFEEIYEAKYRELYLTALKVLGSPEDAEDAVQETLLNVFQRICRLKYPQALNSWMYKILHQRCVDIMRKKRRQPLVTLTDDDIADTVEDGNLDNMPDVCAMDMETREEIRDAILALPEKSREAFIFYYINDMKYNEIADATNTSTKTVSTNLLRAKRKLRTKLSAAEMGLKGAVLFKLPAAMDIAKNIAAKVGIGAAGAVCAAGVTWYALAGEPPAPVPEPEPANFSITLESYDCECGHINPAYIGIDGIRDGDTVSGWDVLRQGGETAFTGNLRDVTAYITSLEAEKEGGMYRLRCNITDRSGYEYHISREIAIGDYGGDLS
jgi:RNA polymerase sigma-70 factor (ECF subfamily)